MGAFRVLLLTFVFVSSTCEASPVARNTLRSVIDQYIGNGTAAEIIADALVVALKDNRRPLDNVNYEVGASAPRAVVSVEVNDVSSSEVPNSSLELKAAAERLAEMKAKQKLVSIEILKVIDGDGYPTPKKIRKIRRRKLVTKGSLRLSTARPFPIQETATSTAPSPTDHTPASYVTSSASSETTRTPTDTPLTSTEEVTSSAATTTASSAVPSGDGTTISTAVGDPATSVPAELASSSELPTTSERALVPDSAVSNLSENSAQNSSPTESWGRADDSQNSVTEVPTSAPVFAVSTDPSVTSDTENIPVQDSTTAQGLHADKINVENEVLASATHEQPAYTTEMPSTVDVKTLKVVSPTGDSHEVKVLSNVRKVSEVDLSQVPILNEKSQVAVDIGGLRYRQTPRRIKIKVPKGGDTTNIQPPRGYSLLRAEPTASASHEEFTFVREQTTVPASTSTASSLVESSTEIPTSTGVANASSPPETSTEESATLGAESAEARTTSPAVPTEPSGTSVDRGKDAEIPEWSPEPAETTTISINDLGETTTAPPPSTAFTNSADAKTEVSVATSISAVESTTEVARPTTTSAPLPELLKELPPPARQDFQTILEADDLRSAKGAEGRQNDQRPGADTVQDVERPEQVTEDWIQTSVGTFPPRSDLTRTAVPESHAKEEGEAHFGTSSLGSPEAAIETADVPPATTQSPETSTDPSETTLSAEKHDQSTATLIDTETTTVTEKLPDAVEPIGTTDSPQRNQDVGDPSVETGSESPSATSRETPEMTTTTPNPSESGEAAGIPRPIASERVPDGGDGDNNVPASPRNGQEKTSLVESIPSDVPQDVPGVIPTSETVTETASSEQTGGPVGTGQQISDNESGERGLLQNRRQDPPEDLPARRNPTEVAAVSSESDKRIEVQEELIVPERFPELHGSGIDAPVPNPEEVSPSVPSDASGEELDSATPSTASVERTESAEVSSEVPAEFKEDDGEKRPFPAEEETPTTPEPSSQEDAGSPQRMIVLDRMNVPVLPFGGSRFAELGFQKADDGSMKMVINDVMAIIREQDMPPSSAKVRSQGIRGSEEDTNPPPILSQPKIEPSRSIVTQVPKVGLSSKTLMPDAPTIIMQIPANTPQAKFSLRRIPGHINVPSVYEILDPERRNPARSTPQIENGRAIVTLPLLPLRALPPIQQNYYRYNRIPDRAPQTQQQQQYPTPQTFFPQDVYPQQFQTSFPQNYERLFPQSYPSQQGNVFYINTKRRSR